ncbi:MAG TPA: DUF3106 domain-containing protein [Bryobacteraceae bacterium]|jgi:hypothetical protein
MLAVLAAGSVCPAAAQGGASQENILKQKALRQQKLKELKAKQQKMLALPAPAVQRLIQMSPEERERALSRLTPERRQQVEQALGRLQQLPPDQLQRLQDVYPAFLNLRPARRQAVRQEIQELRQLRPVDRRDRINSDARDFSPDELGILRQVTGVPE